MFVHIGNDIMVKIKDIVMILDYHKIKKSAQSQKFLSDFNKKYLNDQQNMKEKDIKTIIITQNKISFSPITPSTIEKRMQNTKINLG